MSTRTTTADARKKFSNIINRVAFGKESIILMRRGEVVRLMLYPIFFLVFLVSFAYSLSN